MTMAKTKENVTSLLNKKNNKFWEVRASKDSPGTGELLIYGPIFSEKLFEDEVSPKSIKEELDELGDIENLNIYINSPGGNAFSGSAIYSILKRHPASKVVHIDGLAASAASVIAMAGDQVIMPENSIMMIHRAWTFAIGDSTEMRKEADILDRVDKSLVSAYQEKSGLDEGRLLGLMSEETWMNAKEAEELGFADEVTEEEEVAAYIDPEIMSKYKNLPEELKNKLDKRSDAKLTDEEREQIVESVKSENEKINQILGVR